MAEFDKTVNEILGVLKKSLAKQLPGTDQWDSREKQVSALKSLIDEVHHLRSVTKPVPRTLGDISDLPEELRAELSAIKTDDVEDQIFTIVNSCENKEANIDTILVELYRRFQGVHKRNYITNKLWRMVNKSEMLWNGSSGKGYYTTIEPKVSESEIDDAINSAFDMDIDVPF